MNREELKALGLTDEQIEKVMASHGKVVNPLKAEVDKVKGLENEITTYKQQIAARDTQLIDLSKKAEGNEELQKQIKDLQKDNADAKEESDNKLAAQRKEFKLELALKDAQAKNPKAVKALLNQEAISLDGDNLIGLEEQLKSLKESDAYLFGDEQPAGLKGRQPHPTDPNKPAPQKNPFSKEHFNLTEQGRLLKEDPELYKQLKASAK
ncbi:phage scaffolding protein [Cytobacillus horneckiae]|uniref:phage scaffolding protein n=1 Tax=Cytobacillus horneckiae TaxID=549687 RepID=UPI003D9AA4CB